VKQVRRVSFEIIILSVNFQGNQKHCFSPGVGLTLPAFLVDSYCDISALNIICYSKSFFMRMNSELVQWTVEYLAFLTKELECRWAPAFIETIGS